MKSSLPMRLRSGGLFCCGTSSPFLLIKTLLFFLLFNLSGSVFAQDWVTDLQANSNPNFFEIRQKFNEYWAVRPVERGKGFKVFKRWEHYWETRINPDGSFPDPSLALQGLEEYNQMVNQGNRGMMMPSWTSFGAR